MTLGEGGIPARLRGKTSQYYEADIMGSSAIDPRLLYQR
jgi:hypothetical protein